MPASNVIIMAIMFSVAFNDYFYELKELVAGKEIMVFLQLFQHRALNIRSGSEHGER